VRFTVRAASLPLAVVPGPHELAIPAKDRAQDWQFRADTPNQFWHGSLNRPVCQNYAICGDEASGFTPEFLCTSRFQ
jgi:hypothetical protein